MLKEAIINGLVENIMKVERFILDRQQLTDSVVVESLRLLSKWAKDLTAMPATEVLGAKGHAIVLETLQADPKTRELLVKIANDVVEYLDHYHMVEATAEASRKSLKEIN